MVLISKRDLLFVFLSLSIGDILETFRNFVIILVGISTE